MCRKIPRHKKTFQGSVYVVFITRSAMIKEGKTVYHLTCPSEKRGHPSVMGSSDLCQLCGDDGADIAGLMQYFKNTKGEKSRSPKLSDHVRCFKGSQEGGDCKRNLHLAVKTVRWRAFSSCQWIRRIRGMA